ncbi:MAG: glycine cleavage system aminomethyltransferase GcvT [Armatimonadota bacterium]
MGETSLRRTNLYDEHVALGGRMVPFAGWELPVQYDATGPTVEHHAVRNAAGLFDIDHMGQIRVSGPDADAFLNSVQTIEVTTVDLWGAHYSLLPYADGGLVDDIFLYRLSGEWWVVVNAANRAKDVTWLRAHAGGYEVLIEDISDETYMLALQGPKAQVILQKLTDIDLRTLAFHTCTWAEVAGSHALIGATGYTGEYGYELFFPADKAVEIWRQLLETGKAEGLLPAGLAARDSLRFEAALPLYGHEIGPDIDPYTAGLGSFVKYDHRNFVGRDALLKSKLEGSVHKLVGFEMIESAVPRDHYPVLIGNQQVGWVTTGMKSPTTGKFQGMAIVPAQYAAPGTEIAIEVRGVPKRAQVVKRPFYTPAYRR